jgi:hypothetical protein
MGRLGGAIPGHVLPVLDGWDDGSELKIPSVPAVDQAVGALDGFVDEGVMGGRQDGPSTPNGHGMLGPGGNSPSTAFIAQSDTTLCCKRLKSFTRPSIGSLDGSSLASRLRISSSADS